MKEAPFKEIPVAKDAPDAEAAAARKHLHEVMEKLVGKRLANTRDEPATKPAPKKNTKKKNRQNRQSVAP